MQLARALGIATAIGLGGYAVYRARKAEKATDAFATWFLERYEVADEYLIEMELAEG